MNEILAKTIIINFIISLISLIGVVVLPWREKKLRSRLLFLVALSAGVLMGAAFFHLLPEAMIQIADSQAYLILFVGFGVFYIIERLLHWHHCHLGKIHRHTFGTMNLFGDGIHNFIDGVIITAGLLAGSEVGWITFLGVAIHELPQEISDFGVLIYSGYGRLQALVYNFLIGLAAVLGGVLSFYLFNQANWLVTWLLPFAAGGFIYIAASDLMPELHKETSLKKSLGHFIVFAIGIGLMYWAKTIEG